eukprot:SAG31_NODE_40660_length_279_cov_1.433333_1_plen_45_part_10
MHHVAPARVRGQPAGQCVLDSPTPGIIALDTAELPEDPPDVGTAP